MAEHIISPRKSWWEKLSSEIKSFSPQVKQGLIAAAVALFIAVVGLCAISAENSRLKAKIHDLELEVLPFRNLAVQEFNRADSESLRKLAESMATLRKDYSTQLATINNLRIEIEQLRKASDETARSFSAKIAQENFVPLSDSIKKEFVNELGEFFRRWPNITNIGLVVDATEKRRRLWVEQMQPVLSGARLPVPISAGMNAEKGMYDLMIFFRPEHQKAAEEIAKPFAKLFHPPLAVFGRADEPNPITVRLMGEPLFDTNGVIRFK